ncbi:MAG: hypothetical protein MK127_07475 [Dehalococcoidia bacterium]|jgi:hypothetical protein|nr:hypothetical protein [Dehalococcoidia bacterium]|tara:strand:- start:198 stop:737 length:540 start_codon:yes stop_codon:yes gene_type:complete
MTEKNLTGALLIIGPLLGVLGWMILGPDGLDIITQKYSLVMGMMGGVLMVGGMNGIKDRMGDGPGIHFARLALVVMIIGMGGNILEAAYIMIGSAAAIAEAAGALSTGLIMLGFAVIGIAFFLQKNVHIALSLLFIAVGLWGAVTASIWYETNSLIYVAYIGSMVAALILGVLTVRSKD